MSAEFTEKIRITLVMLVVCLSFGLYAQKDYKVSQTSLDTESDFFHVIHSNEQSILVLHFKSEKLSIKKHDIEGRTISTSEYNQSIPLNLPVRKGVNKYTGKDKFSNFEYLKTIKIESNKSQSGNSVIVTIYHDSKIKDATALLLSINIETGEIEKSKIFRSRAIKSKGFVGVAIHDFDETGLTFFCKSKSGLNSTSYELMRFDSNLEKVDSLSGEANLAYKDFLVAGIIYNQNQYHLYYYDFGKTNLDVLYKVSKSGVEKKYFNEPDLVEIDIMHVGEKALLVKHFEVKSPMKTMYDYVGREIQVEFFEIVSWETLQVSEKISFSKTAIVTNKEDLIKFRNGKYREGQLAGKPYPEFPTYIDLKLLVSEGDKVSLIFEMTSYYNSRGNKGDLEIFSFDLSLGLLGKQVFGRLSPNDGFKDWPLDFLVSFKESTDILYLDYSQMRGDFGLMLGTVSSNKTAKKIYEMDELKSEGECDWSFDFANHLDGAWYIPVLSRENMIVIVDY